MLLSSKFQAHTNIALIKYWGKRHQSLILPVTSSLSMTLDAFYTQTQVDFDSNLTQDQFTLNGQLQNDLATAKISRFIDLFRNLAQCDLKVKVSSKNFVPTAAGLASSASAYAALACTCNQALGLELDSKSLSILARQGSGSACRSLFGGLVEWEKGSGSDSQSSFAHQLDPGDWGLAMIAIVINSGPKPFSSRQGMQHTLESSPFYQLWPQTVAEDLQAMKKAIQDRNIDQMGQIAEHNALKMHATMLSANPGFTYFEAGSLKAINAVRDLREKQGLTAYFTMDAGPNVKVLCPLDQVSTIYKQLAKSFATDQLLCSTVGPAPFALEVD